MEKYFLYSLCILLGACASTYKHVNPPAVHYQDTKGAAIGFSYQYDVLYRAGNKKYAKIEKKRNVRVVALKITNNTGRTINPSTDIEILHDNRPLPLMDAAIAKKELKQKVPLYLLYMLLTPMTFDTYREANGVRQARSVPVGLIIGPVLTVFNMVTAGTANRNLEAELREYSLDKPLASGQTMYALISFPSFDYGVLDARLKAGPKN